MNRYVILFAINCCNTSYFRYLKDLVPVFNHTCDLMLGRLRKVANGKTEVKMYDEFLKCTLNVIANVSIRLFTQLKIVLSF